MKKKKYVSRQNTPWDSKQDKSILEDFIQNKYRENYKQKHLKLSETDEAKIFNAIKIKSCPYCNSEKFIKKGFSENGIQRYYCETCHRKFTPSTGTIFEGHKISVSEWIEFLLDIFNHGSANLTSKVNKNSISTSIYWLHKVFLVLRGYQDNIILSGQVYIDEMCYKVITSDIIKINGKEPRGISKNQICIGIGYDGNNTIAIVEGVAKTSEAKTVRTFESHIESKSTLIHDEEKAHSILIKKLFLNSVAYNSQDLKGIPDKENPLNPINKQCFLIKQFLNSHSGFNRDDLQDYLNLYCFINNGNSNKLEKVFEFLELALNTGVSLSYRKFYNL